MQIRKIVAARAALDPVPVKAHGRTVKNYGKQFLTSLENIHAATGQAIDGMVGRDDE